MRTTKLLKVLAPIATITPIVALSSCGGPTFSIDYGQNINCKNEKDSNYEKLENIQKAIQLRVNVETQPKVVNIDELNANLSQLANFQNIYYEVAAYYALLLHSGFTLTDWSGDINTQKWTFNLEGVVHNNVTFKYINEGSKIRLQFDNIKIDSYTYQYCTAN